MKHNYEKFTVHASGSIWLIWGTVTPNAASGDRATLLNWNPQDRQFTFSLGKLSPPTDDGERRFRFKSVRSQDHFSLAPDGSIAGSAARQHRVREMLTRFSELVSKDPQALRALGLGTYMQLNSLVGVRPNPFTNLLPWWT